MDAAFRALMTGLVDYAGMFPPARLDLEPAISSYLEYRSGPDAWMLGRFVCPVGRLADLAAWLEPRREALGGGPLQVSALLGPASRADDALDAWRADAAEMRRFEQRLPDVVAVGAVEAKLPGDVLELTDADALEALFAAVEDRCEAAVGRALPFYWERPLHEARRFVAGPFEALVEALSRMAARRRAAARPPWGVKIRCGGVTADAVPPVNAVAAAIARTLRRGVPLKATAGLHHPVRHFDQALGTVVHGFFDVFVAALIAATGEASEARVAELLEETSAAAFRFEGGVLRWGSMRVEADEIGRARESLVHSFGSCSFEEPRDDVAALGLLGES